MVEVEYQCPQCGRKEMMPALGLVGVLWCSLCGTYWRIVECLPGMPRWVRSGTTDHPESRS